MFKLEEEVLELVRTFVFLDAAWLTIWIRNSSVDNGPYYYQAVPDAEGGITKFFQDNLKQEIIKLIEKTLIASPVPEGLSPENLQNIEKVTINDDINIKTCSHRHAVGLGLQAIGHRTLLLNHIKHLHRIMQTPESQDYAMGFDAGFKAGQLQTTEIFAKSSLVDKEIKTVGEIPYPR